MASTPFVHCSVDSSISFIAQAQHDGALAYTQLQQALVIGRELGDKVRIAESLLFLGALARDQHDYMGAQALYEESLALFQELETPFGVADALSFLGQVAQYQSDYQRARTLYRNSLAGLQALGLFQWQAVALCLEGLAGICVVQVQFEEAARLFGAAAALQEVLRGSPSPSSYPPEDKHKDLAAHLGEEAFAAAWAAGHALSAEQAIDYALALPAPIVSAAIQPRAYPTGLTEREVEVLRLLAQGLTYVQIAETLVISRRTVNAHVISIYSKLGVNTRFAAARFAADHHLI